MQKYYLTNLLGNPLDTAIAGSRIILSGLLEKLPNLKICLAHGGGHLPYIMGRIHRGFMVRPECKKRLPTLTLGNILGAYTLIQIIHHQPALEYLIRISGSENVLMGTDYPYYMGEEDPVGFISDLSHP